MFKNFFKVTLRSLLKSKLFVFINILGLGLALACCIVAYLNYEYAMSSDKQHQNFDELYQVSMRRQVQGNEIRYGIVPMLIGQSIENDVPGISGVTRFETNGVTIKNKDRIFNRRMGFVDDQFLDMFTFPLKYGSKENLKDQSNVFLTEPTAIALFGNDNVVGETIEIVNNNGPNYFFKVGGVFEELERSSSIQFSLLTSFENYYSLLEVERGDWQRFVDGVFVQAENPELVSRIPELLQKYVSAQNEVRKDFMVSSFWVQPMADVSVNQRDMNGTSLGGEAMNPAAIVVPNIMAILILLLACFNFTNTAIAISNRRLKEIGIRKVVGGSRGQLIFQFLGENLLLCFLSLILAVAIATWLVPEYSNMWGLGLEMNLSENLGLVAFLASVLLLTAFMAGGYPALYVSKFRPVSILRGTLRVGGSNILSKILLGLQFTISLMALILGFAFIQNANYQNTLDQGYDEDQLIVVPFNSPDESKRFQTLVAENPTIQDVTKTNHHIGWSWFSRPIKNGDQELEVDIMDVGLGYDETVGFEVRDGRFFNAQNQEVDKSNSIVINERLARSFNWQDPVGQKVTLFDTLQYTVVGVVKDFYLGGLWDPIDPIMIRLRDDENLNHLVARVDAQNIGSTNNYFEEKWAEVIQDRPYSGFLHEQNVLGNAKDVNNNIVIIFGFLAIISVVLSAIGLFTLVSLNILGKVKEIGVRKVLGASITNLTGLINRPFLITVIIASIISGAMTYFMNNALMDQIWTYHMTPGVLTFLVPILLSLFISFLSISGKVIGAAKRNPVESLRYE